MAPSRSPASDAALPAPADRRGAATAVAAAALALALAGGWTAVSRPDLFELPLPDRPGELALLLAAAAAAPVALLALVRRPALALVLLVVFVQLNLSEVLVRFHGMPSLLQLLALPIATAAVRVRGLDGTARVLALPLTLGLAGYLLVVVASTTWAWDRPAADERVAELAKAFAVYLLAALLVATARLARTAAAAAVAAGALLAALGVWQVATGRFGDELGGLGRIKHAQIWGDVFEPRIAGPLGDPNYFALALLATVPLALALAWAERDLGRPGDGARRAAALAAAAVLVAGTVLTYSRAAALVLLVVLGLAVAVRGIRPRHLAAAAAAAVVVALLVPEGFSRRLTTLAEVLPGGETEVLEPDSSFAKRLLVTGAAWRMFVDRPWLGVGAGNYGARFQPYADRVGSDARLYEEPGERNYPHNLYLEVAAETGVVGLAAFLGALALAVPALVVVRRHPPDAATAALAGGVAAALAGHLLMGLFLHGQFPRYLYLLLGLAAGLYTLAPAAARERARGVGAAALEAERAPAPAAAGPARRPALAVRRPIAVFLSRFPRVTETFILREVAELERQGQPVVLVPLIRERAEVVHREAEPWVARALYTPWLSPQVVAANLAALGRRPAAYLGTLARLLAGAAGSPHVLWRTAALFPKSVLLADRLARRGVRHVHAHFATHPATAALAVSRLAPIDFSFTVHAHDLFVRRQLLGAKLARARFVRSISRYNRDLIAELYPGRAGAVEVVHVGVPPAPTEAGTEPLGPAGRRPSVLCVAALREYKGIPVLVDACRRLRDAGVDLRCEVIGEGPDRAAIEARIAAAGLGDRVVLLGARRQDEVRRRMAAADAAVLPSVVARDGQMEGIPVALMEAAAAGKPVVASRLSGVPELVRDGETGLLVPPGDPGALADAIRELLADPVRAGRMGEAGRRRVRSEFDLATTTAELLALLDRVDPPPDPAAADLARRAARPGEAVGLREVHESRDARVAAVVVAPAGRPGSSRGAEERVVKMHLDRPGASRPARERARREAAVAAVAARWGGAPRPLALDARAGVVVFAACRGERLDRAVRRLRGRRDAGARGELAGAVHAAGRWLARFQRIPADELAPLLGEPAGRDRDSILEQALADLAACRRRRLLGRRPRPARLEAALRRLAAAPAVADADPVPVHGDLWPGNLFVADGRAAAIDFEGTRLGHPLADAAYFLVDLDLFLLRPGLAGLRAELTHAFLAGWGGHRTEDGPAFTSFRAAAALAHLALEGEGGATAGPRARLGRRLRVRSLRAELARAVGTAEAAAPGAPAAAVHEEARW